MMETKGPKKGVFVSMGFSPIYRVKIDFPDASFLVSSYRGETRNETRNSPKVSGVFRSDEVPNDAGQVGLALNFGSGVERLD